MNPEIQQYIRVMLYTFVVGPLLVRFGIPATESNMAPMAGVIIGLATLAWTIYSSRLNALLARAKATKGVETIEVKIDPAVRSATDITVGTPPGVVATIAAK